MEDLRKQLDEARNIKQEVVERGQSANMKVRLLNDELSVAQKRIASLVNALISARVAIKVLKSGGSGSSTMKVSVPKSSFTGIGSTRSPSSLPEFPSNRKFTRTPLPTVSYRTPGSGSSILQGSSLASPSIQKIPVGNSSIQLRAQVQFLNNKNRPAGFTEFFLVKNDLESILQDSRIRIPQGQGIDSGAELWARSVQRGYRYPGVASRQLGLIFYKENKFDDAMKWFNLGAKKNDPESLRYLGILYFLGQGVKLDYKAADKWLTLAAQNGDLEATRYLRVVKQFY